MSNRKPHKFSLSSKDQSLCLFRNLLGKACLFRRQVLPLRHLLFLQCSSWRKYIGHRYSVVHDSRYSRAISELQVIDWENCAVQFRQGFIDCFVSVGFCLCCFHVLPAIVRYVSGPNNWRVWNYRSLNLEGVKSMRMWMVDPKIMCRNHLLEEHAEIHLFVWNIDRQHSVKGYLDKGLLETHNLYARHAELAQELKRRGYHHNSELECKMETSREGWFNR
jgi:hypothetical protein